MTVATIHQVIELLDKSFRALQADIAPLEVEELAITIHRIMSVEARQYHSLEHIWELGKLSEPTQQLAALFHDLVHCEVDGGVPREVYRLVAPYIGQRKGRLCAMEAVDQPSRPFQITMEVFGFQTGQELLAESGLSEFLSALFMHLSLEGVLSEQDLLRTSACIEATIPFRGRDDQGRGPMDRLAARLHQINEHFDLSMTPQEVEDAVEVATLFGNRDVFSFAREDPANFLEDTWKLLPEANDALRSGHIYTVREFRQALWNMAQFMQGLDPHTVFHRYQDVPSEETIQNLVGQARRNIQIARDYLEVKLLAMAVLESLAEISGGDAPLALFTGTEESRASPRLEQYLSEQPVSPLDDRSRELVRLFDSGRAGESPFDIQHSPLSLFLYQRLGAERIREASEQVGAFFEGELGTMAFLDLFGDDTIARVAAACAEMVPTRRAVLLQYARMRSDALF